MPSTNKTETLGLNLWEPADKPTRSDFCADNRALEKAYQDHLADTTLHKSSADKAILKMGTYTGTGAEAQVISLPINPQYLLAFDTQHAPLTKEADGTLKVRFAFIKQGIDVPNVDLSFGSLSVISGDAQNGVSLDLNEQGTVYQYIAIQ